MSYPRDDVMQCCACGVYSVDAGDVDRQPVDPLSFERLVKASYATCENNDEPHLRDACCVGTLRPSTEVEALLARIAELEADIAGDRPL